jgi:hypothetical protein
LAFPDRVIPSNRIDPAARAIMDFFYPLPNLSPLANGFGRFQEFVPKTRERHRGDIRLDYQPSGNDSIFARGSFQHRNPNSIIFEAGNALTNMPSLDTELNTASMIGGWTKIFSPTLVNEFRAGFNYDNSRRESTFAAAEVTRQLGIENAPSLAPDRRGFPQFTFPVALTGRPTNISDAGRNVDRTLRQNAFSVSNNLTWIKGGHTLKGGGLWTHNTARDGFGFGVNYRGRYRFRGTSTGNGFTDFLLGLPTDVGDHISNRGPLEGHSNDIAGFIQDDWRANKSLTVFLGMRYEVVGTWHENDLTLANFRPVEGGYHVVPNDRVAALLPPGLIALGRTRTADEVGLPETLLNADKNNFSPRVGFAWRLDESNRTVLRSGFGLFHPTVAVQGIRDLMATNEFRYGNLRRGGGLRNGFSGGTPFVDLTDFGNQGIDPDLESPDIYQYNVTLERELPGAIGLRASYIGSTMRKLLVDRDFNTLPASTVPFDPENQADYARLPFPLYGYFMDNVSNAGEGQFHALQFEVLRRWRGGVAFNAAYTLADSESNAPDTGNSKILKRIEIEEG